MSATPATPRTNLLARDARELERELATANARLEFMIDNAGQAFAMPNGWRCTWICYFGDEHETSRHRTAFAAIDAAIAKNAQINDDIKE